MCMRVFALSALLIWTIFPAAAQSAKSVAKAHGVRRMPDGHLDLQGTYDLATLTPMERPAGTPFAGVRRGRSGSGRRRFYKLRRFENALTSRKRRERLADGAGNMAPRGTRPTALAGSGLMAL